MTLRRIVLVAPFGLRPKGTTIARVLPIGRVLANGGAQVRIVIPPWDDPEAAGTTRKEDELEIVHTGRTTGALGVARTFRDLLRLVDEFEPDVIHAFKPIGFSGAVGWWKARQTGRSGQPLVVLDTDDLEGPRGWSNRRSLAFSGWLRGWQEIQTLRAVPRVTVASRWLESFVASLGVGHDQVYWMPQGWTPDGGDRRVSPEPHGPSTLLWYTRFTEVGPARAARLFAPLLASPERRLIVLGDEIAPGARSAAEAAFATAGLVERVLWRPYGERGLTGLLEAQAISLALYPMDDDLANRARCPTKLVELMAAGVPVVAEAVGEASSYLAGFEAECLASPGDVASFTRLASRILEGPALGVNLSERLGTAAQRFEWKRLAGGLLPWYEQLAAAR